MLLGKLLLGGGVLVMLVAVAYAETALEVTDMRQDRLQCSIPVTNRPTWLRNGVNLRMSPNFNASRIMINDGSATITFLPALPEDEGRYQCRVGSETSREILFQVPPYAPQKFLHACHGLGTNFTLPCGVIIGDISRQIHHRVQWLLYMVPPAPGAVHTRLFLYDSSQDDDSTMEFDGMYQFNPSNQNFSLHVTDFVVDTGSLQQHVVYYECTVTTYIRGSSFLGTATTNVTFEFESATILTPPPPLLVAHPGENATIQFTFGGFPNPTVEWKLGNKILSGPKYTTDLQHIGDSDNVTRARLTVVGLDERDTGLLTAAVQYCMFSITTSTEIVTISQITEVAVINSTSNDTQCGTQDLNLAFCLPVRIPVDSLQLKVNFTEVLDPSGSPRRGRFMVRTYPAQTIYNATQVRFPIPENVAQAVEGYPRFRLQAKLIVNGTEGQIWSEFSPTIQTHCTSTTEKVTLRLGVQFNGGTCFSVRGNSRLLNGFSAAIQDQFHHHCTFQCERLTVKHPSLVCPSDTLGTFSAVVSAYAARALVQQFYELVEAERVTVAPANGTSGTLCIACIPANGLSVLLICVLGMTGIVVFLVVLMAILVAVAIKKRHNNIKSGKFALSSMPNVDDSDRPPTPLPQPSATPPTCPKMLVTTFGSTKSLPAVDICCPECTQSTTPLAVYPSVSPGYVTHTHPTSPPYTIATLARPELAHFLFPPKCVGKNSGVLAKASIRGNHCANCGVSLGSMSDSCIVRPGYIPYGSHRSTGELQSSNPAVPHRSPAGHKCLEPAGDSQNGSCPGRDQPCSNSPNERYRHASMPLDDHTAGKEKSLRMPCKCRKQFSMHSLDLRTSHESCNTFPSTSAQMQANEQGCVVQDVKTSGEAARCGPTKCKGMQDGYIVSGDSSRPKRSDSSKAAVPHCPDGYLTHYPPSSGQMGRMASEKHLQSHHYVRQTKPVGHRQTQAFARDSCVPKPTTFSCSRDASKCAATLQHSADTGLRSYSPQQVVQLPDNVVEGNGEPFRTQLWLLGDEGDGDCDLSQPSSSCTSKHTCLHHNSIPAEDSGYSSDRTSVRASFISNNVDNREASESPEFLYYGRELHTQSPERACMKSHLPGQTEPALTHRVAAADSPFCYLCTIPGCQFPMSTSTDHEDPDLPTLFPVDSTLDINAAATTDSSVPFMDPLDVIHCTSDGGVYYNPVHDITVRIPEGAISKGASVAIEIGVALYGPFQFPDDTKPVSPIVWLCVKQGQGELEHYQFLKPVEVVLPHYLHVTTEDDSTLLHFLKAGHHMNKREQYQFQLAGGKVCFPVQKTYGTLSTYHFCFLCIASGTVSQERTAKANFCLISVIPDPISEPSWTIYFCVCYFLQTCVEAVLRQFPDGVRIRKKTFRFSVPLQDAKIVIDYERKLKGGWILTSQHGTKISASEVDFWSIDPEELQLRHDEKLYPPRFEVRVGGDVATEDTFALICFRGVVEDLDTELELRVHRQSLQLMSSEYGLVQPLRAASMPALGYPSSVHGTTTSLFPTRMLDNTHGEWPMMPLECPTDQELEGVTNDVLGKLGHDWIKLQHFLQVPDHVMVEIDSEPTVHRRMVRMLKEWRNHSGDESKAELAKCLKASDKRLETTSKSLLSDEYRMLTPPSSRSGSGSVSSSSTSTSSLGRRMRPIDDTPLSRKNARREYRNSESATI